MTDDSVYRANKVSFNNLNKIINLSLTENSKARFKYKNGVKRRDIDIAA